jgi:hypothetical protein
LSIVADVEVDIFTVFSKKTHSNHQHVYLKGHRQTKPNKEPRPYKRMIPSALYERFTALFHEGKFICVECHIIPGKLPGWETWIGEKL